MPAEIRRTQPATGPSCHAQQSTRRFGEIAAIDRETWVGYTAGRERVETPAGSHSRGGTEGVRGDC